MKKGLASFADLPKEEIVAAYKAPAKAFKDWEVPMLRDEIMQEATQTLAKWIEASLRQLYREAVSVEDINISHRGGRTVIRVAGVDRFEFKLKCTFGKAGAV